MSRRDRQRARANGVSRITDDQRLLRGEIRDPAAVLQVLRVAVRHGRDDPVLDGLGQALDGAVHEGRALAVAGDDDLGGGGRAARGRVVEQVLHLGYAGWVGAAGDEVGGEEGRVVDALRGDVGHAEGGLDAV